MAQHKDLSGSDLHEPKGITSATNKQVYVANGAGSGSWVGQKAFFTGTLNLTSTATTLIFPFTLNATVTKITAVLSGALTGSTTTITATKNGTTTAGTMSAVVAGSAKGTVYTIVPTSGNTFIDTDRLELNSAGGTTANQALTFLIEVTLT
jgi:hypothetical protein